jgi:GDP-fucose protein O-fucosyltransferase
MFMSWSSNTVRNTMMIATATIFLLSMSAFLWDSTVSVYVYKYNPSMKVDHHGKKFLSYLPHSGLSNQRTELENALLLASYLNRTLILPPAFLGHIRGWQPKDHLLSYIESLTKPQPWWNRCNDKLGLADGPCHSKGTYATVPWEFLHSSINELDIPVRSIRHVSVAEIKAMLTLNDDEVYVHHDNTMYSWQLCDKPKKQCPPLDSGRGHAYEQQWTIEDLQAIDKPLIQLQGIFGTGRVSVSRPEHLQLRSKIRESLIYRSPAMEQVTDNIAERLGGKQQYFSIHVRMGDHQFLGGLHKHVEEQILFLEKSLRDAGNLTNSICETKVYNVYVATDAKNPRKSPELAPIFARFPCARVLGDYIDLLSPLDAELDTFQPPQKSIVSFLIPIIDAMVAGNAKDYMGTPGSTFSEYIKRLHSAYRLTKYHP